MVLSPCGFMLAWCSESRVEGEAVVAGTLCDGTSPEM